MEVDTFVRTIPLVDLKVQMEKERLESIVREQQQRERAEAESKNRLKQLYKSLSDKACVVCVCVFPACFAYMWVRGRKS